MAKIADLPQVATPDGNETVVVLKDGIAKRASIAEIIAPSLAALQDRVFAPKFASFGLSRNPVEYGDTGAINLAWTVTDAPASQKLNGVAITNTDRSAALAAPVGGWVANTNETVALFNASGVQTDTRTATITPRVPIFAGIVPTATPDNATLIGAAYKALDSDQVARKFSTARAAGGYPFLLVPAALALTTIKLNTFAVSGWAAANRNVTLLTGAIVPMKFILLDAVPASASALAWELS